MVLAEAWTNQQRKTENPEIDQHEYTQMILKKYKNDSVEGGNSNFQQMVLKYLDIIGKMKKYPQPKYHTVYFQKSI